MIKRVLVINPFGIGDVVFSMALVGALKRSIPQVTIGFVGNERTLDLLRMNAQIDICHEFNRDEWRALRRQSHWAYFARAGKYIRELREQGYDALFDLSLGREFSFAGLLAGIPKRIGFDFKRRGFFLTHKTPLKGYEQKHVVDWQLSLLKHIGLEPAAVSSRLPLKISPGAEESARFLLAQQGIDPKDRYFVLAPGGGRSWGDNAVYKQWSPERFAQVSDPITAHTGLKIVLMGDAGEAALLDQVRSGLSMSPAVLAGEPLERVAAVLKRAEFILCNDGGLLHLANALGVRSVSVYGPVDEKVYGPYGNQTRHSVLTAQVPCRPCYQDFHFPPCAHQRRCQDELTAEKVLVELKKIP